MIPAFPSSDDCLFLDVDGTLIDIAPTPDSVRVPPGLLGDLRRADRLTGGALALVSGRTIADLDGLFAPARFKASGVHGAEMRLGDGAGSVERTAEPLPDDAWRDLKGILETFPASIAENKRYSFAVHYRAAPDTRDALLAAVEGFLAGHPDLGLAILPGHFVFDLKPSDIHKGAAIAAFMRHPPFAGRRPIFIGDDITDEPGFRAVAERGGLAYSVGRRFPGVVGVFDDAAEVRRWLAGFAALDASAA